jgi:methionine-rich copper-binding protein CopC
MKKLIITSFTILLFGAIAFAQSPSPASTPSNTEAPEVATKEFMKHLEQDLKLTEQQKTSISQATLDKKNKILKARQDYEAFMKSTLTADQYRKWVEMNSIAERYISNP